MQTLPVSSEDQAFLFQVYASTRKDELSLWGWDEAMQNNFLKMQWTAQQQSYAQQFANSDHRIILLEDIPVGSVIISRSDQQIRLVDIALLPEHRNKGIGALCIQKLQDEAAFAGIPLHLSVIKTNPAQHLYKRLGFLTVGEEGIHLRMEWQQSV